MKKILIFITFILSLGTGMILADDIRFTPVKKNKPEEGSNKGPHRSPFYLDIKAEYDEVLNCITVYGDTEDPAEVFVTDETGFEVGYSPVLNCTIDLPVGYEGMIYLYIDSENWYATGSCYVNSNK